MSIHSQIPLTDQEYALLKRIRESNPNGVSRIGIIMMDQYERDHRQRISDEMLRAEIKDMIYAQECKVLGAIRLLSQVGRHPLTPAYFYRQNIRAEIKRLRVLRGIYIKLMQ